MSAASNARWIALAQVAKLLIQLAGISILGRILSPRDFGLLAMLTVVTNLIGLLRDMGTTAAIIQKRTITDAGLSSIFWLNVALGVVLSTLLCVLSGSVAQLFHALELRPLLVILAPAFLLAIFGAVQKALLERKSAFRTVFRVEVFGAFVGALATIGSALSGAGAMSWTVGILVTSTQTSIHFWMAAKWHPTRRVQLGEIRSLLHFSGNLSAFNVINYLARNADSIIVGRYLDASALGIYSIAYKIMLFPLQNLTFVANRALYPLMSSRQDETQAMASLYFKSVAVIGFFTAPLMMSCYVLRDTLIAVLMGEQWRQAAEVLRWLAPTGYIQSIVSTTGTVSLARGRADILFRIGLLGTTLYLASFFVGIRWGVVGVAACYLVSNILIAVPALWVALRQLDASLVALARELWTSGMAACIMGSLLTMLLQVPAIAAAPAWLVLGALSLIGGCIYLVAMAVISPTRLRMVLSLLSTRWTGQ
jgi:PST family polysaccharide transporter